MDAPGEPAHVSDDAWGITEGYWDTLGNWYPTSEATRAALRAAMGGEPPESAGPAAWVARPGDRVPGAGPAELTLEDGGRLRVHGALPPDLPLGYHTLEPLAGGPGVRLIVAPDCCHLPAGGRAWGWAVQLYAARSRASWGIGDLADLRRLARWSARELGAGLVLVNPLCAPTPVAPVEPSPYLAGSRRYRNPLYLRVEEVPGAAEAGADLERLAAAGRALNAARRIDYDAVLRLKLEALELAWRRARPEAALDRYLAEHGQALVDFATFCVLAERHGRDWRRWPAEHRRTDSPAVARFRDEHADRVRFHQWLQWCLDVQLAHASTALAVIHDLPIGVDPGGADAWAWQDVLATEATVGAPPDAFSARGQDWGLPPFVPHRLAALGYGPFVETIRSGLRHAGGLRIDHVMGLFRLYWIPRGLTPAEGAYVRYPHEALLAIVALESHRARAVIVGEDLGTVEPATRERLAAGGVLSTRVLWFERVSPRELPELALAAVTTHDLPTVAGLWTGFDLDAQKTIGLQPNEAGTLEIRERLGQLAGVGEDAPAAAVVERIYRRLAEAPSRLLTATLEDACAAPERHNMPGTVTEWPNWSLALPAPLEELETAPLPRAIAAALRRDGHAAGPER